MRLPLTRAAATGRFAGLHKLACRGDKGNTRYSSMVTRYSKGWPYGGYNLPIGYNQVQARLPETLAEQRRVVMGVLVAPKLVAHAGKGNTWVKDAAKAQVEVADYARRLLERRLGRRLWLVQLSYSGAGNPAKCTCLDRHATEATRSTANIDAAKSIKASPKRAQRKAQHWRSIPNRSIVWAPGHAGMSSTGDHVPSYAPPGERDISIN